MQRLKKILIITISAIIIFVVVVIVFISPITKYLVEKYDVQYTGREIKMDWAYVNPFTGYVHFSNLRMYELKSDSVFFRSKGLSASFALFKMLHKTYEITKLSLNQPWGIVVQSKKVFNFNDLIEKFTPKKDAPPSAPLHFNILDVSIIDGEFHYLEKVTPVNYFIKKVNFESSGKRWDADTIAAKFSFLPGIGKGDIKGNFTINLNTLRYRFATVVRKFDLSIIQQYMNDIANYGSFSANLDADLKATGNFKNEEDVTAKGLIAINDFHFGKNKKEDYASFDRFVMVMKEVSPLKHIYFYDSVLLTHPYFKYERYDHLDNLQNMFGKKGANYSNVKADPAKFNLIIEIADYVKVLSKNFFKSDYKVNRLAVYKGDLKYNDFAISEKFFMDLNPLYILADSIDKNHKRVNIYLKSGIKPYGNVAIGLSINPKDSSDFDLQYNLQKLAAAQFNPYTVTYTSFLLDRGTIEFNGNWHVRNGAINSTNHLTMIDPRVGKRLKNQDNTWLPLPLIMAFVREQGNVIDYEIPITGNLKDPKFDLWDVIIDVLTNIFVKPVTIPYRIHVKNTESEIEKSLTLKWEMLGSELVANQKHFIKKMSRFLLRNPDASIAVSPQHYTAKEKEYILFFEAKKKYYLVRNHKNEQQFTDSDSICVARMSVKDSVFLNYVSKQIKGAMLFTVQEKCAAFTNPNIINARLEKLNRERAIAFMLYFKKMGVDKQLKFSVAQNVIPYNGYSFYKIDYNGEYPEALLIAYSKMNGLNNMPPRKEFKVERQKTGIFGKK